MIILAVIVGLSLVIILHEAGHFFAAKIFGMKVDEFGFGFPPKLFSKKKGDTEYSFNLLPFGGFVRIAGETDQPRDDLKELAEMPVEEKKRLFLYQPAWKRAIVILAGVFMNFLIGWVLLSSLFMKGGEPVVIITSVEKDSPAAQAGLQNGDLIRNFHTTQELISFVNENRGKEVSLTVLRNGKETTVKATPRENTRPDQGALGVGLQGGGIPKYSFGKAISEGFLQTIEISKLVVVTFGNLLKNIFTKAKLLEGVVGPLGIFGVAEEAGKVGWIYLVQLIALISVNLAVMNLIPFPALDGGRFFMILIEKIKGSPISPKVEGVVNGIGFVLLIGLMLLITARDIVRLF